MALSNLARLRRMRRRMFSSRYRPTDALTLNYVEAAIMDHTSRKKTCVVEWSFAGSDAAFLLLQVRQPLQRCRTVASPSFEARANESHHDRVAQGHQKAPLRHVQKEMIHMVRTASLLRHPRLLL